MKNLPHIVIAGFGETGVLTAIHLNDNYPGRYRITAISTKASLFSGQELGSRLSTPQSWSKNYHTRFEDYTYLRQVERCHGAVESVDSVKQTIEVNVFGKAAETLHYDVLLIASGVSNGFWRDAKVEADANLKKNLHDYSQKFKAAQHIAIVGGGPSGASCAYQLKTTYPDKRIQFYFSGERPFAASSP